LGTAEFFEGAEVEALSVGEAAEDEIEGFDAGRLGDGLEETGFDEGVTAAVLEAGSGLALLLRCVLNYRPCHGAKSPDSATCRSTTTRISTWSGSG